MLMKVCWLTMDSQTTWTTSSVRTRGGSATFCVGELSKYDRLTTEGNTAGRYEQDIDEHVCRHTSLLTSASSASHMSASVHRSSGRSADVSERVVLHGVTSSSSASRDRRLTARVLSVDGWMSSQRGWPGTTTDVGWLHGGTFSLQSILEHTSASDDDDKDAVSVSETVRSHSISSVSDDLSKLSAVTMMADWANSTSRALNSTPATSRLRCRLAPPRRFLDSTIFFIDKVIITWASLSIVNRIFTDDDNNNLVSVSSLCVLPYVRHQSISDWLTVTVRQRQTAA